jgi:cell pole-organizing protein PopZ
MDIKIPSSPLGGQPVDAVGDLSQTAQPVGETAAKEAVAPAAADAVSKIAARVAAKELSCDEAVDLLLAQAMDSPAVKAAPASVRAEIAEAIKALIETDPYLASLTSALGLSSREP